jgi:hypothetical protein
VNADVRVEEFIAKATRLTPAQQQERLAQVVDIGTDPRGACVYYKDGDAVCENLTQSQCSALGGHWVQGRQCANPLPAQ